jgi:hypothetical protein
MQKINCWLLVLPCVAPWHYFTWLINGNSLEPPGWKPVLEGEKFTILYIRGNVYFGHNIFWVQCYAAWSLGKVVISRTENQTCLQKRCYQNINDHVYDIAHPIQNVKRTIPMC